MDNRTLLSRVAKATGADARTTSSMAEALTRLMADSAAVLDNVAIPGFGTFVADKEAEHVGTDTATGARSLMPPAISVQFRAATKLRKSVAK